MPQSRAACIKPTLPHQPENNLKTGRYLPGLGLRGVLLFQIIFRLPGYK
jgi:hypothetical protein